MGENVGKCRGILQQYVMFLQKLSMDTEEKLQALASPTADNQSVLSGSGAVSALQLARQEWELIYEVSF